MDMVAVDIHVLIDYEGLFTEAEFVQILAGKDFILLLRQFIVGVRIQEDMQHRLFSPAHFRHEQVEILHHAGDVNMPVCRKNYLVRIISTRRNEKKSRPICPYAGLTQPEI